MQQSNNLKRRLLLGLGAITLAVIVVMSQQESQNDDSSPTQAGEQTGALFNSTTRQSGGDTGSGLHHSPEKAPAELNGLVLAPDQAPVEGAIVLALPVNQINQEPTQAKTDADGRFGFKSLPPGTYKFSATAENYTAVSSRDIRLAPKEKRDNLRLLLSADGFILSGTVQDSGGGAIPDAEISANLGWNNTTYRSQSDSEGVYELMLPPGNYQIKANAPMYASKAKRLQLSEKRQLNFELTPAATLHGKVIQRDSLQGVPKAVVRLHNKQGWQWRQRTVTTNDKGFFEFDDVDPGNYELSAHKEELYGSSNRQLTVTVASAVHDITIEMDPGYSLSGRIQTADGSGIPNASVVARDRSVRSSRLEVASNSDGTYIIAGLAPGRYSVRAKAEGFSNERLGEVTIIDQNQTNVDLTLKQGVQISGRLETQDGRPVANAVIRGTPNGGMWFFRGFDEDQSQQDGSFHLQDLPAGDIKVQATHTNEGTTNRILSDLAPGEHLKDVVLTLQAGATVTGIVQWDDGAPAEGLLVYARSQNRRQRQRAPEAVSGQNGRFRLAPLWEGDFEIWATTRVATGWRPYPDSMSSTRARVSLDADNPKEVVTLIVERQNQVIQGKVLDPEGAPLPDTTVGATRETDERPRGRRWQSSTGEETTQSAADGSFTLGNLPQGNYTIHAAHPGYPSDKRSGVAAGSTNFILQLKQGASLAGVVTRGGVPVTSYDITASPPGQRMRYGTKLAGTKVSNPDGTFVIQGLPAQTYTLTVESSDGNAGRLENIVVSTGEAKTGLVVELDAGVELSGTLYDGATNEPLVGAQIFASSSGGRYSAQSDEQGEFTLTGIAEGSPVGLYIAADRTLFIREVYEFTATQDATNLGILRIARAPKPDEKQLPPPVAFEFKTGSVVAKQSHESTTIQSGDVVLTINGVSVAGFGKRGLRTMLSAPAGSKTILSMQRNNQETYTATLVYDSSESP